jgi:hypothetical protein
MPCCFKKDQLTSGNKFKMNYYKKCIGAFNDGHDFDIVSSSTNTLAYKIKDTSKPSLEYLVGYGLTTYFWCSENYTDSKPI